jgi:outer membrane protein assembly factor BamB
MFRPASLTVSAGALLTLTLLAVAADWPQWQGIARTAISKETGLLKSWPKEGPPLKWKVKGLGGGYSTPSVAGGRIFGMAYCDKDEVVYCLSEQDGKELWVTRIAGKGSAGYNEGPRCSPTVDGNRVYVLGISSDLVCLEAATGQIVWRKNLKKDYGGKMMSGWGFSESPLIDGDKLIVTPGGKDAGLIALDKKSAEVVWKSAVPNASRPKLNNGAGYSSVIAADVHGVRQYIQFMGQGVVGVRASDGQFLWMYDAPANGTANISTPLYHDGHVFAATAYGTGGGQVKLSKLATGAFEAKETYFVPQMQNHHGGMVLINGFIYGTGSGTLICIDWATGKIVWQARSVGKGSVTFADGHLYVRSESGPIALVEANPREYVEKGRFNQPDRSNKNAWPHPVIANGCMYILDQDVLLCYDVRAR